MLTCVNMLRKSGRRYLLYLLLAAALSIATVPLNVHSYSDYFPNQGYHTNTPGYTRGYTGAFGERTCMHCHVNGALNPSTGSVTIGQPANYTPSGPAVPVTVTIQDNRGASDPGRLWWGFQLSSRFQDGTQAGSFTSTSSFIDTHVTPDGVQYAKHMYHKDDVAASMNGKTSYTFTVMWTPPATGGNVLFDAAGVASDGNYTNSNVFTATQKISAAPNPVPALTTILAPTSAFAGRTAFTISLQGSGFASNSVVRWNGSDRTTFFYSNTDLTAQITAADVATAGTAQVTVFNPAPAGGLSNALAFTINNRLPVIGTLAPSSVSAGGGAFTLTVTGFGFVSSSVVRWNGLDRTTTFVNDSQVTASIPASDIASAATAAVTVFSPTPGGGTSNALQFKIAPPLAISGVSPGSLTLSAGNATPQNATVNLARSGFTGSVTLSVGTLPAGVTANITQPGTGDSGTVSFQAAANAAFVSFQTVEITASGSGVPSATSSILVTVAPLDGSIVTIAGDGNTSFSGDDVQAVTSALNFPTSVAVDASGNVYIADSNNRRIRRVAPDGIITTVAGNGNFGFAGDGGPATAATLSIVYGVAIDAAGNIYFSDSSNGRIRKFAPGGNITTFAGSDGSSLGDNGPATSAQLDGPRGIAVDSTGNVYIATVNDYRIRKVSNGTITTVAGNGTQGFSGDGASAVNAQLTNPTGVAVDNNGNIYILDGTRIRKVTNGNISTVAGGGLCT